jgi:nucleoside-diphosphate kinase
MANITLTMIKPDAVAAGNSGKIIDMIIAAGFQIEAMKLTKLSTEQAEAFYAVHKERSFFPELIAFMTEAPIVAAVLRKENAVEDFRTLIGATNPANAAEGTIRKAFATDIERNAVHGSDSNENAAIEASFHFAGVERF